MSIGRPSTGAGWRAELAAGRLSHADPEERNRLSRGAKPVQRAGAKARASASAAALGTISSTSPPKRAISLTRLELT